MDRLKDIVPQVIEKMVAQKAGQGQQLQEVWAKLVGELGLKHTKLGGMKDGILVVYVDSSAWLFQMNLKRSEYLNKLKKESVELKKIIFKIGKV